MEYGIVYLLTNPVMPGLVKIGMTTREDMDARMNSIAQVFLYHSSASLLAG
jgi:hypothetical protein